MASGKHVGLVSYCLRALYVVWVVILMVWLSLEDVKWFHFEQHKGKNVVSFNWHPLFMSFAVLVFMSEAILAYRVYENHFGVEHKVAKLSHAALQGMAVLLMGLGLFFVFENHALKEIKHLYSAHSWLGVMVTGFMGLQALQGVMTFLVTDKPSVKAALLPLHKFMGLLTYLTAVTVICMGLQEKTVFLNGKGTCKGEPHCAPLVYANVLTLLAITIAGLTTSTLYDFETERRGEGLLSSNYM